MEFCGYRIELAEIAADFAPALAKYNSATELVLLRRRPKGDKEVDIKKYVDEVHLIEEGGGIAFDMKVTPEGTARPDEIIEALAGFAGKEIKPARIVRTEIRLKEEEQPKPPRPGRPPYRGRRR